MENINNKKKNIEEKVVDSLKKQDYSLNATNAYGNNILHTSATNGCNEIIKEIIKKPCRIDQKNKFGWTPLMQAIRNKNVETVKLLLKNNSNVNESTYLGMSVLGLAAAISEEMFDIIYKACPSALQIAANDDISPLCIAAMKNDKHFFFKLLSLGLDPKKANEYTHLMMRQSTVPEIASLAIQYDFIENYWSDQSDNIDVFENENEAEDEEVVNKENNQFLQKNLTNLYSSHYKNYINNAEKCSIKNAASPKILISHSNDEKNDCNFSNTLTIQKPSKSCTPLKLNLLSVQGISGFDCRSQISPNLTYNCDSGFPRSPKYNFSGNDNFYYQSNVSPKIIYATHDLNDHMETDNKFQKKVSSPFATFLQRIEILRPADLKIQDACDDFNGTLTFTPEFSPTRSPNVPDDINDQDTVFSQNTPTPPRYTTPPRGMLFNPEQAEMVLLLRRYGLSHHVPIFLKEEVDFELFLTLSDNDLQEIGIEHKADREALLKIINDYYITDNYE
ncbi:uncharacterized protein LOC107264413 [Cephus cinctus]|uniref:Uncharacterized protein LOC107264413 n=1 Tax=Cephus cinctus TaxID=211228 RepID=A0AAJ7BKA2_CEPCN|nr:uncharacterized protein LOC107264413 [Cephus cinctus]